MMRGRLQTYSLVLGVVIGVFAAGIGVPLVFADRAETAGQTAAAPSSSEDGLDRAELTPSDDEETPTAEEPAPEGSPLSETEEDDPSFGDVDQPTTQDPDSGTTGGRTTGGATTGGTTGGGDGGTTTGDATTGGGTDGQGASGEPIKVGVLLLDIGNVSDLGFPGIAPVEERRKVWQYWIDQHNEQGGVHGRPIKPFYKTYDPLSEEDMREACLYLTEDKNVFVAVAAGGFIGPPVLCFTEEHQTPFLVAGSSGVPQEFYPRSDELLFTSFMGSDRTVLNFADQVDRLDAMDGKNVGILFDLRSGPESIARKLEAEVEARGHTVSHVSIFSADYQTSSSQVPVEVQQHRANGTEVMLNMSHALAFSQFVQEATNQGYIIPYFNSDWNGANSDFYYSNMPDSYDGNLNFTIQRTNEWRADMPEPAVDRKCREQASEALDREVPRDDPDANYARQCAFWHLLRKGLTDAGSTLNNENFSAALQTAGRINLPGFGGTSFQPGRFNAGDHVRTMEFNADCSCIIPVSDFRPTRF